jgi:geranylgeranyl pyrophosphate synthase
MSQILLDIASPISLLQGVVVKPQANASIVTALNTLRDRVLPYLTTLVDENTSALQGSDLSGYVTRVASKLERAWFTQLAASTLTPEVEVPISLLAAVELRYLFELILDDIADCSTERCNGATLHLEVGVSKATYLAEILIGSAIESLGTALEVADVSQNLSVKALKSWGRQNTIVSVAQCLDLTYEQTSLDNITSDMAIDLIDATTGQDLANCFFLGGVITGASSEHLDRLHKIGQCIGILMQMRDDVIDYIDDSSIINKEPLLDFKNGHKKLPLVAAYHHSTILEKQEILALMQQSDYSPEDITRIQQLILNPAALAYQANLSNEFIRQIDENIEALGAQSEAAETLRTFVHTYLKLDI